MKKPTVASKEWEGCWRPLAHLSFFSFIFHLSLLLLSFRFPADEEGDEGEEDDEGCQDVGPDVGGT